MVNKDKNKIKTEFNLYLIQVQCSNSFMKIRLKHEKSLLLYKHKKILKKYKY